MDKDNQHSPKILIPVIKNVDKENALEHVLSSEDARELFLKAWKKIRLNSEY